MSWWDTGEGDDVIGDRPADLLTAALFAMAQRREAEVGERPSLAGLLAGVNAAVSERGERVEFVAETEAGSVRGRDAAAQTEGTALVRDLREALQAISAAYQERWEREPRPSEVARLLAFVLGPSPERYLRVEEDHRLELTGVRAQLPEAE